jgi:hypothetical protein
MNQGPRPAWILQGPPGSGKTQWILTEAKQRNWRLFRWNVRNDRSLREGREILHSQVRSQEKTCIWIEGADDLTQESQAFLRRILDTRSSEVQCILEVRDVWKLSAPILSRCIVKTLPSERSYRRTLIEGKARSLGIWKEIPLPKDLLDTQQFQDFIKQAGNPTEYLLELLHQYPSHPQVREGIRRWQAGHSPWVQVGWLVLLLRSERDRKEMGNNQTNANGRG